MTHFFFNIVGCGEGWREGQGWAGSRSQKPWNEEEGAARISEQSGRSDAVNSREGFTNLAQMIPITGAGGEPLRKKASEVGE